MSTAELCLCMLFLMKTLNDHQINQLCQNWTALNDLDKILGGNNLKMATLDSMHTICCIDRFLFVNRWWSLGLYPFGS